MMDDGSLDDDDVDWGRMTLEADALYTSSVAAAVAAVVAAAVAVVLGKSKEVYAATTSRNTDVGAAVDDMELSEF